MNNPDKYKLLASAKDARRIIGEITNKRAENIATLNDQISALILIADVLTNVIIVDIEQDFKDNAEDD